MAKSMINGPTKLKKIKPESQLQRRNSTGGAALIFSEPIPSPNYLRASISSCHDLCKYGSRRDSSSEPATSNRHRNTRPEAKYKTKNMVTSTSGTKDSVPRKQETSKDRAASATKNSLARKHETSKSTSNAGRNNEGKRVNSLPCTSLPESSRTRRSKSFPTKKVPRAESEKLLQGSECCNNSEHCDQTIEEKTMHVVDTNDDNQNHNEDVDDQKIDSAITDDCCSTKLELKEGRVVEAENKEDGDRWKEIRLRRVVSEGDSDHMKKECMREVFMGKNKVKDLVDSFETLMTTTQDSRGSTESSSSS